jgi:hypothetical protein
LPIDCGFEAREDRIAPAGNPGTFKRGEVAMRPLRLDRRLIALAAVLVVVAVPSFASASSGDLPWQTGIHATGNSTIEPAVNDITGAQTFLRTPNNSAFWNTNQHPPGTPIPPGLANSAAPLYLVTYPLQSTVDVGNGASPLNCYTEGAFNAALPYNCDHAQIPGIKGHDHLVGVPGSQSAGGDFNVAWHVLATFFTAQGIQDGAMNIRILTLADLEEAQADGDVGGFVDTGIYFHCSVVSSSGYMNGTALSFPPFPA